MPEAKTLGCREIEKAVDAIDLPRVLEAVKVEAARALAADLDIPSAEESGEIAPNTIEPYLP